MYIRFEFESESESESKDLNPKPFKLSSIEALLSVISQIFTDGASKRVSGSDSLSNGICVVVLSLTE